MKSIIKRMMFVLYLTISVVCSKLTICANEFNLSTPSYILMEAQTGKVICEENADEIRSPASITKIMTLLIALEKIKQGSIKLTDEVTTSAYAKSMGGSQVFLEEGEVQSVETLLKCIAVASGNDASVALAEKIAGSEEEFVNLMNAKAKDLHLENTNFVDCCGLSDSDLHHTTARDVALMSRELITKHPEVYDYTKIWMEDITHVTKKGSETFTLSSTNKLLKQYEYATGLKTGSTGKAKYCLSATANHNGIDLIAVLMGAPDYKIRFSDARTLLDYGYQVSHIYHDENNKPIKDQEIIGAIRKQVSVKQKEQFHYLDIEGNDLSKIEKKINMNTPIEAPVKEGEKAGQIEYYLNGNQIGSVDIVFGENINKAGYKDYFILLLQSMLL